MGVIVAAGALGTVTAEGCATAVPRGIPSTPLGGKSSLEAQAGDFVTVALGPSALACSSACTLWLREADVPSCFVAGPGAENGTANPLVARPGAESGTVNLLPEAAGAVGTATATGIMPCERRSGD